jgi:hypothetical protein
MTQDNLIKINQSVVYRNYICRNGLKNVFFPLQQFASTQTEKWMAKAVHELIRYADSIVSLDKGDKIMVDNNTLQALHESLFGCSASVVFCMFNVFSLATKTEACFYDTHIKEYFAGKVKLNREESYLLSFDWHESIHFLNTIPYCRDERLQIHKTKNGTGFNVNNAAKLKSYPIHRVPNERVITGSIEFFTLHLLYLINTIDLMVTLLGNDLAIKDSTIFLKRSPNNPFLKIENINDLVAIYEKVLDQLNLRHNMA